MGYPGIPAQLRARYLALYVVVVLRATAAR